MEAEIEDITEEMEFEYELKQILLSRNRKRKPEEEYEKVISFEELIELDYKTELNSRTSEAPKKITGKIQKN